MFLRAPASVQLSSWPDVHIRIIAPSGGNRVQNHKPRTQTKSYIWYCSWAELLSYIVNSANVMEESSSSDGGPSLPIPSLQNNAEEVLSRTPSSPDGRDHRDPSESTPLLKVKFGRALSTGSLPPTPSSPRGIESGGSDDLRRCNWKKLITTIYLWLTYLIVSAAYSIIGPFFPSEVCHRYWLLSSSPMHSESLIELALSNPPGPIPAIQYFSC